MIMNKKISKLTVFGFIVMSCFLLTRCTYMKHNVKFETKTIEKKAEIHLTEDQDSPTCSLAQVLTYLDESETIQSFKR